MKKLIPLILAATMVIGLSACGASENQTPEKVSVRTVTDVWEREVVIPNKVNSIVCLGSMAPRLAAYLGVTDMLAGVEDHDKSGFTVLRDYNAAHYDRLKELPAVGAGGGSGQNNGYPEQIIGLMPDVIIAGFEAGAADELQRQTGIPVVSVRCRDSGFIDGNFAVALRVFAQVVDKTERCESVLEFIEQCKSDLKGRTSDIPHSDRPSAYTGAVTFNGRHGFSGTYAGFGPFIAVNALNVADGLSDEKILPGSGFDIDLEQVLEWDPDFIFLDPGNLDLVNQQYSSNPEYFKALRAVREGRVYTMPSFNNCGQNVTYAIINAYHAGKVLYPERFEDIDLSEKAGSILEFMLGENILPAMESGGLYYGKITIGG